MYASISQKVNNNVICFEVINVTQIQNENQRLDPAHYLYALLTRKSLFDEHRNVKLKTQVHRFYKPFNEGLKKVRRLHHSQNIRCFINENWVIT